MIWKIPFEIDALNHFAPNTIAETLDIRFVDAGEDFLVATMPVDHRTVQPMGLLHGGASVVLAETLGSIASTLCISPDENAAAVGIEVNANHLRSVTQGKVKGIVRPIRVGRKIHVWEIDIFDEKERKCCVSRLTTMVVPYSPK